MQTEKLDLHHQALLEPALHAMGSSLSEYSFANLYLFRQIHNFDVIQDDNVYVAGTTYDGFRYLMPTSLMGLQELASSAKLWDGIDFLYPIADEWLRMFEATSWHASFKPEDSDYIFDMAQMSRYSGRHLSKKRNLVKQFREHYEVLVRPFASDQKQAANHLLDVWHEHAATSSDEFSDGTNTKPCREAIELFETLKLEGQVYYVGNEPVGFIIGEANMDTFVIHFSKANTEYKGIYQYMYQNFASSLVDRVHFLNMEQDLGRQDLRQAKHSYQPIKMCKKMRLIKNLNVYCKYLT